MYTLKQEHFFPSKKNTKKKHDWEHHIGPIFWPWNYCFICRKLTQFFSSCISPRYCCKGFPTFSAIGPPKCLHTDWGPHHCLSHLMCNFKVILQACYLQAPWNYMAPLQGPRLGKPTCQCCRISLILWKKMYQVTWDIICFVPCMWISFLAGFKQLLVAEMS